VNICKSILFSIFISTLLYAGEPDLLINVKNRTTTSLNGQWNIIIDPYENGYYDYRYKVNPNGYFKNYHPQSKSELVEYDFDKSPTLNVPGDWNSQQEKLFLYEGTIWYKKSFDFDLKPDHRLFLYFGAINYQAQIYLNGEWVGMHEGGFTPFNFEITGKVANKDNFVIIKADNKRLREAVPTVNTDWFNYGGITRDVLLVSVPQTFIRDYFLQLEPGKRDRVKGWLQLDGLRKQQRIRIRIPQAGVDFETHTDHSGKASIEFHKKLSLWSPQNPILYDVIFESETDTVKDRIGFRTIEVRETDILLNGKPVFLRGICIHEEAPFAGGTRAHSMEQAAILLGWAKELNCNFVRLAHYPHNENIIRLADEMGMLVWSEIPVYWTILWDNPATYENAENQLTAMISRDKNRASVILWSMANETPPGEMRLKFLGNLVKRARMLDDTRLITAAMQHHYADANTVLIDDPFGELVDVLGCNAYIGWYDGLPQKSDQLTWQSAFNKPLIMSEFGGGALYGHHGDSLTRWTEEYQESIYLHNLTMFQKIPFLKGLSPWILKDFRSPRRALPGIQDFWNRKGLISDDGNRKKAFYLLQDYYKNLQQKE